MNPRLKTLACALLGAALCMPTFASAAAAAGGKLTIVRLNSQDWQVRLASAGTATEFSGVLDSSVAFTRTGAVGVEGIEGATRNSPTQLAVRLAADAGDVDTVNFSVPSGASMCLRDTGSTAVTLYRGADPASARVVTAPVPLGDAKACADVADASDIPTTDLATGGSTALASSSFGEASLAPDATTSATTLAAGRKFNPGHYIALLRGQDSQAYMAASTKAGVRGFMKRYTWRQLEPTKGNYNLSEIQSDLAWCQSYGKKLIVMIEDKTFTLERPTPAYLDTLTVRNRAGGYTAVRWNPTVVARMQALMKALGRFDTNAAFEGVATQETALGFDDSQLNSLGYTPEKYRDAYIAIINTATAAMPTSRYFWFMNFFARNQQYIAAVANATYSKGVVMGGPDVMPDNKALQDKTYPFYDQFQYKMHMFGQVEPMCYSHRHATGGYSTKYWTMPELFRYARDELHTEYMIWVRLPKASFFDSYEWTDALPTIANNATF